MKDQARDAYTKTDEAAQPPVVSIKCEPSGCNRIQPEAVSVSRGGKAEFRIHDNVSSADFTLPSFCTPNQFTLPDADSGARFQRVSISPAAGLGEHSYGIACDPCSVQCGPPAPPRMIVN